VRTRPAHILTIDGQIRKKSQILIPKWRRTGDDDLDGALGLAEQGDEDRDVFQRESEDFDAGADL
jgi:hypothetical protein